MRALHFALHFALRSALLNALRSTEQSRAECALILARALHPYFGELWNLLDIAPLLDPPGPLVDGILGAGVVVVSNDVCADSIKCSSLVGFLL